MGGHAAGLSVGLPPSLITQSISVMAIDCLESNSMALSPSLPITAVSESVNFHHNIDRGKVGIILDARYHDILQLGEHRSGRFEEMF